MARWLSASLLVGLMFVSAAFAAGSQQSCGTTVEATGFGSEEVAADQAKIIFSFEVRTSGAANATATADSFLESLAANTSGVAFDIKTLSYTIKDDSDFESFEDVAPAPSQPEPTSFNLSVAVVDQHNDYAILLDNPRGRARARASTRKPPTPAIRVAVEASLEGAATEGVVAAVADSIMASLTDLETSSDDMMSFFSSSRYFSPLAFRVQWTVSEAAREAAIKSARKQAVKNAMAKAAEFGELLGIAESKMGLPSSIRESEMTMFDSRISRGYDDWDMDGDLIIRPPKSKIEVGMSLTYCVAMEAQAAQA